ncbi:MAG: hypothetical protein HC812_08990 [Leptolyngbya sp. RL_3_1]|nr:hypothetical protein [Leptolyngbya sp. RL_3_1]
MGQQDNFGSGFLLGTLFGGLMGGVVGAVVAARVSRPAAGIADERLPAEEQTHAPRFSTTDADIELARRGLEDKIAQLNTAIDDVRQRLSSGDNGHRQPIPEEHPAP